MDASLKPSWEKNFSDRVKDEKRIRRFANQIGDKNPLHHNTRAAKRAGLQGIIAPGAMLIAFISSMTAEEIPMVQVLKLQVRFVSPVYAGSQPSVLCQVSRQRGKFAEFQITIKNGFEIIAEGSGLLMLPRHQESSASLG